LEKFSFCWQKIILIGRTREEKKTWPKYPREREEFGQRDRGPRSDFRHTRGDIGAMVQGFSFAVVLLVVLMIILAIGLVASLVPVENNAEDLFLSQGFNASLNGFLRRSFRHHC